MFSDRPEKVATPAETLANGLPLSVLSPGLASSATLTGLKNDASTLPSESSALTTKLKPDPAVMVPGGWLTRASLVACPAVTVKLLVVPAARPGKLARRV